MTGVVKFDNITLMRSVSWVKAAKKAYERFPMPAQREVDRALGVATLGEKADIAKPMVGFGSGVMEIAVKFRGDAWSCMHSRRNPPRE